MAARHLLQRDWHVEVVAPKVKKEQAPFNHLLEQMHSHQVPVHSNQESVSFSHFDVILDAIFGFSFQGVPREPFLSMLHSLSARTAPPLLCVDVPSGMDVDTAAVPEGCPALSPDVHVSLTAPKQCTAHLPQTTKHYLGGRFIPAALAKKFELNLPRVTDMPPERTVGSQCFLIS